MKNITEQKKQGLIKWVNHLKENKYFSLQFGIGIDTLLKEEGIKLREGSYLDRQLEPYSFYLLYSPKGAYSLIQDEKIEGRMNFVFGFLFTENGLGHIGSQTEPDVIRCHVDSYGKTEKYYSFLREATGSSLYLFKDISWKELRVLVNNFTSHMDKYLEKMKPAIPCF